ncbi:piggyBac transposable element-derived protein 4-like [Anastrepha ludens]|uniref:piggyBac transposable element-derived protein 4-like n=1 Tax=Anastrepha ludens TaxID=28586 RepID=UPI0023B18FE5|nr:piggyBac transposable element-derived protein 4-like [Anastrepha ludens]
MPRVLNEREIADFLLEDIPSDGESVCSVEPDEDDNNDGSQSMMVLGDIPPELQPELDDGFTSDDDVPLSNLVLPSTSASHNQTEVVKPKWKRHYKMEEPSEYIGGGGVPTNIIDLENVTPTQLFRMFWSEDLVEIICFQTNLYATQKGTPYTPTTPEEIEVFLALNLVMGIKKMPSYKNYWSSVPDLHDPYISSFMPLNRFGWLLNNMHLNDSNMMPNKTAANYDKLYKVRPLLDILQRNFDNNYYASEKVAIDESMIKFKGRNYLKQYMPKKPIKRGYKVWIKCAESGYCLDFDIYTGKEGDKVQVDLGGKVVRQFCEDLKYKNHKVFFDNYFNSYFLQVDLRKDNVLACGTVNSNRKNLPKLKDDKDLSRGQYDYRVSNTNVAVLKWKDKRPVFILTNYIDPTKAGVVTRRERNGDRTEVACPEAVMQYNICMNYVDKFDQLKSIYAIDRKSHKWWHRIFFHFLDCAVVNAILVYKEIQKEHHPQLDQLDTKDFRRSVYQGILAPAQAKNGKHSRRSLSGSGPSSPLPVLIKRHKPSVPTELRTENNMHQPERSTSRRCAKCSTKRSPARTVWQCITCKVPLCIRKDKTCFVDFHKK